MKPNIDKTVALANAFDPDQTRSATGNFSAALADAVSAAHMASAKAHESGNANDHTRAAKLHRTAAQRAIDENQTQQAATHEGIAKCHEANAAVCAQKPALANDGSEIDDDGWALIAPFGKHPKTRVFHEGGLVKEQKYIQVLDNESADAMLSKENSFFGKLKRALVGIPIFKGHGDLKDHDPKALANDAKVKLGVVDQIRKSARGIEAHFALDNEGAAAVADGYKLPSALWLVTPIGNEGDAILARPFKLLSVALTPFPNISGVESLANARTLPATVEQQQRTKDDEMKQLIIGWLAAKGIVLANDATDQQVLDAIQKQATESAASVTTLGNEKNTLSGTITTLTADRDAHKKRADESATALANETTARKAERKHAATAVVDLAIQRGKKTVADRETTITALENSTDFEKDSKALLAGQPVVKIAGQDTQSGKVLANERDNAQSEYDREFKAQLALCNQDPVKAHTAVMQILPGLAEKLRVKQ